MLRTLLAILFSLSFVLQIFAGGSIDWDQVKAEITKDDPFMADFITSQFDLQPVGDAVRIGHDKDGNSLAPELGGVGKRIPPYNFLAKPKAANGDFTLVMTLEPIASSDSKKTNWQITIRKRADHD